MARAASKTSSFSARILRVGMFFVVEVPAAISRTFEKTSHVPVVVSLGGETRHRTTLLPRGKGLHYLPLKGKIRREAGAVEGDRVTIEIALDREPRTPDTPVDLARALRDEDARTAFESIAPGRRRQYILWLDQAVHEKTRDKRIARLVEIALAAREKTLDREEPTVPVDVAPLGDIVSYTKGFAGHPGEPHRALPVPIQIDPELKPEVDQILESIIYLYTESRRITKEFARRANLTGPQLTVVKILEAFGDLSLSELSERLRAQNSTVTGIVDRMEREELVIRTRSTEDRRVVKLKLTEKGARIARDIAVEPMELFKSALVSLTATEARDLLRILTKIARRVQAAVAKGAEES
jgi:DNA-binding MarR family transcriptional regulator